MSAPRKPPTAASLPAWLSPAPVRVDLETREGRIEALGSIATALLEGKALDVKTRVFLGAALLSWLGRGGDLEKDHLKVCAPAGSHRTPALIWSSSSRGEQDDAQDDNVEP